VSLSELLARRSQQARARSGAAQLPDIDRGMAYNELAASDYAADIHRFYKRVEGRFRVHPEYMDNQVRGRCRVRRCTQGRARRRPAPRNSPPPC
jgi:hypothetical protein